MKDFQVILGIKAFFKNDDYELLSKFSPLTIPIAKARMSGLMQARSMS